MVGEGAQQARASRSSLLCFPTPVVWILDNPPLACYSFSFHLFIFGTANLCRRGHIASVGFIIAMLGRIVQWSSGGEVLSEAFALSCNVATHGLCRRVVVVS